MKKLLYKPCFGTKEEYLDYKFVPQNNLIRRISSHFINTNIRPQLILQIPQNDLIQRISHFFNTNIRSQLIKNTKNTSSKLFNEENTYTKQLYVVPLPDFTVYPDDAIESPNNNLVIKLFNQIFLPRSYVTRKDNQFSPFLNFIKENENEILYDNPAIEACINSKWSVARRYFLQRFIMFLVFSIIFALHNYIIKVDVDSKYIIYLRIFFFYIGYRFIAIEIIQCIYEKKKYVNLYNAFDLVSIFIPMYSIIMNIYTSEKWIPLIKSDSKLDGLHKDTQNLYISQAFAVLILWLQFVSNYTLIA